MTKQDDTTVDPVSTDLGNPNDIHDDDWEKEAWEDTEDIEREKGENGETGGVDVGLGTRGDLPDTDLKDDLDTLSGDVSNKIPDKDKQK